METELPPMPVTDDYQDSRGGISTAFWDALRAWQVVALAIVAANASQQLAQKGE